MRIHGCRRGRCSWCAIVGAALGCLFVPAESASGIPQALRVQEVRAVTASTGRVFVKAILNDEVTPGAFEAALAANQVSVEIRDAASFQAGTILSNCRQRASGRIRCSGDRNAKVKLKRTAPSVYELLVFVRHVSLPAPDSPPPQSPVTVTLHQVGADDRVDVISDCVRFGARSLTCNDRNRPNIIFIVTDDQRWDTVQYMPHVLDRLAGNGVQFSNAFVATPLCAPSRATMLTGQYAHNHGVLNNVKPYGGATRFVGSDSSTLATWLQGQGYRTGLYGKYLTNYAAQCPPYTSSCYVPPGWDEWHVFVNQSYYEYRLAENAQINFFGLSEADYSTDVLAAKAVEFVLSARGQNFFLHIGFHAPHGDTGGLAKPAPRHTSAFSSIPPWRPPNYDEADVSDKPPWMAVQHRASDPIGPFLTYGIWGDVTRSLQLEALLAVDEAVESLVVALDATGQLDNTIIVYTSDNGYLLGEHRIFFGKDYPYEESVRVPLIVRDPLAVGAPRTEDRLVVNTDLAPTLAALARVAPLSPVDGMNFAPLLREPTASWRSDFLFEWGLAGRQPRAASALSPYAGVRNEQFKYCEYNGLGVFELYDVVNDPYELDSLASNPAYAATIAELQLRLDEYFPPAP